MKENLLFVSFLSTNYGALEKHWSKYSVLQNDGKRGSDRPFKGDLGGKIALVDWKIKKIIWEKEINSPSGILYENGIITVNSINLGKIVRISYPKGNVLSEINHPYLNKPHSLIKTLRGFLVASTGLDAILELDCNGNAIYKIFFTEHGYDKDQFGKIREIDKNLNHQSAVYPSLNQTTHVNYARYIDQNEDKILATLFHPGELIQIDKKTNTIKVILENMKQPHNIRDFSATSYVVCDTGNNKILEIDKSTFKVKNQICGEFSWVQDAVKKEQFMYIADADNHRIVRISLNNKNEIEYFNFSKDDRIYQILPIDKI